MIKRDHYNTRDDTDTWEARDPRQTKGNARAPKKQNIASDQLVPPGGQGFPPLPPVRGQEDYGEQEREVRRKPSEWITVGKQKGIKNRDPLEESRRGGVRNGTYLQLEGRKPTIEEGKEGKVPTRTQPRRRAPRTAAATITGRDSTFSYAEALRKAREEISLKDRR